MDIHILWCIPDLDPKPLIRTGVALGMVDPKPLTRP